MKKLSLILILCLIFISTFSVSCQSNLKNIQRPEKIVSMRQVMYDQETYTKLANLWKEYYDVFPSEDAYANWMYAARYAKLPDYESLLKKGLSKYPANSTLLYLTALLKHGAPNNTEAINLLEKAVELDPTFLDAWFALAVDYMGSDDSKKFDTALKNLLMEGAISHEVMDYNYNVISLLDKNAILITNGDNDTYPAWILTRIIKFRPDVKIVNRSLLNSEWYPMFIIKNDHIPSFITEEGLTKLRNDILEKLKSGKMKPPEMGPFSDTLLTKLVSAAEKENRPVYLTATLYSTDLIKDYKNKGINLGLVTLINPNKTNHSDLIKNLTNTWLTKFKTGGLTNWKLIYGNKASAGKRLMINYAEALVSLLDDIKTYSPEKRLDLFLWYQKYILDLIPKDKVKEYNSSWCKQSDIKEIKNWCKSNNYIE